MNIETVNELIRSLESAGELSIREQKFLKLAKEFRICSASLDAAIKAGNVLADQNAQLAAENVALKQAAEFATASDMWIEQADGMLDYRYHEWYVDVLKTAMETPATDRIVAGIKADAQSEVIEWLDAEITAIDTMYRGEPSYERDANWMKSEVLDVVELARKAFPAQLREGAK
ncbi:MAG: hypothetical protein ACLSIS_20460 [Klebsiella michiganensis]